MKTLFGVYDSSLQARQIAQELVDAGFAPEHVHVVDYRWQDSLADTEPGYYDRSEEREGSFGDIDPEYHDRSEEREGSFADVEPAYHDRGSERQGSFADVEPTYHDRRHERQGSFADGQAQQTEHAPLIDSLTHIGLTPDEAEVYATQVSRGAALVVVHANDEDVPKAASIVSLPA